MASTPTRPAGGRHHVVIVGAGFGGLFAAKRLADADVDVTIIDRTNHHLFQPLLYQVATGVLSSGEIAPTIRQILRKQKNTRVVKAEVRDIDVPSKVITADLGGKRGRPAVRLAHPRRRCRDSPTSATTTSPSSPRA
jgi:NADH dehydrogenase